MFDKCEKLGPIGMVVLIAACGDTVTYVESGTQGELGSRASALSETKHRAARARGGRRMLRNWRRQGMPMAQATRHCDLAPEEETDPSPPVEEPEGDVEPSPEPEAPAPLPTDIVAQSELPVTGWAQGEELSSREVWRRLKRSRATCFGELHDNPFHHNVQQRALEKISWKAKSKHRKLAVGFEMFQRPFQSPLTHYKDYELSESEFLEQTEYQDRWGWDFSLYRPLLDVTRYHGLPALALNARRELTRQIGREGPESLSPELEALLPELNLEDEEHQEYIYGLFGATHGDPAADWVENYYVAQTTWDETMASTSSDWLVGGEKRQLLVLAGIAHCHRSAIPRRIERRTELDVLSVAPVLRSEWSADASGWEGYDLLVILDDTELVPEEVSEETASPGLPSQLDAP